MLDFPVSPFAGQLYDAPNGVVYQYQTPPGVWRTSYTPPLPPPGAIDVISFGADPTGIADSTVAFQAAVDAAGVPTGLLYGTSGARAYTSWVYVPPGTYKISTVNVPAFVGIRGGTDVIKTTRSTVIKHTDPTLPCFNLFGRNSVRGLFFDVNNTNMTAPTAGPPTITCPLNTAYNEVSDCQTQFSYIFVGSLSGAVVNNAWVINNLSGFVHHRMVFLKNTLDISYVSNLHAQNPEGTAWDTAWYSWTNKVLVETENADGLVGSNWFTYGGRGILKHSGTVNLIHSLQNITGEVFTHGIEIAAGSTNGHHITIDGGYANGGLRTDCAYLFSNESDAFVHVSNFEFSAAPNANYVQVSSTGSTYLNNCVFAGSTGSVALRKNSAGSYLIADNCDFRSLETFFSFDVGCDQQMVVTPSCRIRQGVGILYGTTPTGYLDITEPVLFQTGAGHTQQTVITRRTPLSDHRLVNTGSFLVHEQAANVVGGGASLEASSANAAGQTAYGSRARLKCYNTSGTVGGEAARAHIQGYTLGAYGPPLVVFEKGSLGYQGSTGSGGAVTQATSKTTAVAWNTTTGAITMAAGSIAAGATVAFTFTNTILSSADILHIKHSTGGTLGVYAVNAMEAAGSAVIRVTNTSAGALDEQIVLKYYIFKTTAS